MPEELLANPKKLNSRAYEPISPEVRTELARLYAPHNARLAQLLGRELPASWASVPAVNREADAGAEAAAAASGAEATSASPL